MKKYSLQPLKYVTALTACSFVILAGANSPGNLGVDAALAQPAGDYGGNVDAVSGASIPKKKGSVSLQGDDLTSFLRFGGAAYLLSTVNEDGSPHVAPINPKLDLDGNIRFVSGNTRSRRNIDNNGQAMLTAYGISCGEEDEGTHFGARLVLTSVGEKVSKSKIKSLGLRTMVLEIEEVLPLEEKVAKRPKTTYRR